MKKGQGGQALRQALRRIRNATGPATGFPTGEPELLTREWAHWVTATLHSHDRQFKILNTSLLTALIADIVLRLFQS